MDKIYYVYRCEPVYSKKSDILPMTIRLVSLRPDSGVYTLRVIAPHIFINPQIYSYVTFKNKWICFPL